MTEEVNAQIDPRDSLKLKPPELDVSSEQPWDDDVLHRKQIAAKLTNLIQDQSSPFTISIHGYWGTGKTFLLKRWQRDLEIQGFKAIYFNAWEDDFCDDPLLAILSQLSEYLEKSTLSSLTSQIAKVAIPLIRQNIVSVLEKHTGLKLELNQNQQTEEDPLKSYRSQRASKDELKKQLTKMSAAIREETGHPLVFIIDELDRCRPTFAIELLERVKHIFDVPDLVFIFGINRDELCSSLRSIYGDIESSIYLRRFFDMEFTLPEADTEVFCRHLMGKYDLENFFATLSKNANVNVHNNDFGLLVRDFPTFWTSLGFSLRDIDYCVRTIALVGKNIKERQYMYPSLLGLLIALKLMNPSLYRLYIERKCLGSEVMNYIYEKVPYQNLDTRTNNALNLIPNPPKGSSRADRTGDERREQAEVRV